MTALHVLGSGSRGNAFALQCGGDVLLLDAGFSARETVRRASACGVNLDALVGIVLTHEHGDHAQGAPRLARPRRVPVAASPGTWQALRDRDSLNHLPLKDGQPVRLGRFVLESARSSHDAAEPVAIAVTCPDGARVGIAYDLGRPTAAVRLLLRRCHALVLEANHDEVLLRTSGYPPSVQQRIAGSGGHLSNTAAAALAAELLHHDLELVLLAHLSARCNTVACALESVGEVLRREGFIGELDAARQDCHAAPYHIRRPPMAATG